MTRSFLDSLDGLVARSRSKQRAMIADHTQWGYWMDGLCDLIGTIFFMAAVLIICQRFINHVDLKWTKNRSKMGLKRAKKKV